jgi:tetratricopeptide (TPR) repeat protein
MTVQQKLGDVEATVNNLLLLGEIAMAVGDWDTARSRFEEALGSSRQLDTRQPEVFAYTRLAILAVERDEPVEAEEPMQSALDLARSVASPIERASAAMAAGYVRLAADANREAAAHFADAEREFADLEAHVQAREARAGRAAAQLAMGDVEQAVGLVRDLLPHLDREGIDGTFRPTAMLATVWRVLDAAGDPGAEATFEAALAYLDDTLLRIGDDAMRAGYLAVPVNAELVTARAARATEVPGSTAREAPSPG